MVSLRQIAFVRASFDSADEETEAFRYAGPDIHISWFVA
jgi:hypothetical protein